MVMPIVERRTEFDKSVQKLKDGLLREKVHKQIAKIIQDPELGKPMMYARKGTREVYIPPFRLSYAYLAEENKIILLDLYHKDDQ